ncbi:MAG TPA: hypothetical protein RMH85_23365 [Polyangiaceae bacterium LLY-WYZ-15_(1-7)]|nr:hypothetical protein [Myxococcales bacterium]MAT26769.1 hypothetical protein [Sandaracinus sp.]HJK89910.1 hypothetical protein [Polyangiaceae bacterium LLY-WYZ-15_(1-7)]MBJ72341.1 hypothetical protein [Sandaracinus sp.]HJK99908.1 hypothetical protein [Polyangiaceae bacterium LLY-WYZ-15_(1-7)]
MRSGIVAVAFSAVFALAPGARADWTDVIAPRRCAGCTEGVLGAGFGFDVDSTQRRAVVGGDLRWNSTWPLFLSIDGTGMVGGAPHSIVIVSGRAGWDSRWVALGASYDAAHGQADASESAGAVVPTTMYVGGYLRLGAADGLRLEGSLGGGFWSDHDEGGGWLLRTGLGVPLFARDGHRVELGVHLDWAQDAPELLFGRAGLRWATARHFVLGFSVFHARDAGLEYRGGMILVGFRHRRGQLRSALR